MGKNETAERFRGRLRQLIGETGLSQSAFAHKIGIDRSTLSQVLSSHSNRLPRVETLATIARSEQVSLDWLVGMSETEKVDANLLQQTVEISPGGSQPVDDRLDGWHAEARDYKIRNVPASLPDFLKTPRVIQYEYEQAATTTPEARMDTQQLRLDYHRRPETDTEVCTPIQQIESFARGEGIWNGLNRAERITQLDAMIEYCDELYPRFRWFMFNQLQLYSAPMTLFGPLRAAVYLGQMYFVLTGREHIQILVNHFDGLIRAAVVQPPDVSRLLRTLRSEL